MLNRQPDMMQVTKLFVLRVFLLFPSNGEEAWQRKSILDDHFFSWMWKPDNKLLLCIEVIFPGRHWKAIIAGRNGFSVWERRRERSYDEAFVNYCLLKYIAIVFAFLFKWELENRNICLTVDSPVWLCQFAALVKIQTKCISNIFMPGKRKIGNIEQMFCSICFSCFSAVFHRSSLHTSSFGRNLTSKLQNCERTYIQKAKKFAISENSSCMPFIEFSKLWRHYYSITFTENQLIAFLKWNLFSWF